MKLVDLFDEFQGMDPLERLEVLVEMAETLPALSPDRSADPAPSDCRVIECQTPVDLWVDVEGDVVRLEAHVSRQSPLVRGLVALLIEGISGATLAEVLSVPADVLTPLGLNELLGMVRQRGARGLVAAIKTRAVAAGSA